MRTLSSFIIWGSLLLGVLPLSRIFISRRYPSRRQGTHAKASEVSEVSGPEATRERWYAARLAAMSVLAALDLIVHPHGLVNWLVIGTMVIILLWEPATWLTTYLVRRPNSQDSA